MAHWLTRLRKCIFWLSLAVMLLGVLTVVLGQSTRYEFADRHVKDRFYECLFVGLVVAPPSFVLAALGRRHRGWLANLLVGSLAMVAAAGAFYVGAILVFSVGFLTITTDQILYRSKENPRVVIASQTIGQGALGSDGHRIVQLEPLFPYWERVTFVKVTELDFNQWVAVHDGRR